MYRCLITHVIVLDLQFPNLKTSILFLAKNCDWFKFKKLKKTWIERCRHLCICPLIDHRRELIRMQELLGLLYNMEWISVVRCKTKENLYISLLLTLFKVNNGIEEFIEYLNKNGVRKKVRKEISVVRICMLKTHL